MYSDLVGKKNTITMIVTKDSLAGSLIENGADVFATPYLVGFIEDSGFSIMAPYCKEGETSVGVRVDVFHLAPTPEGMEVKCTATVESVDGKKILFSFEVYDEVELVAKGTHLRAFVPKAAIEERAEEKRKTIKE